MFNTSKSLLERDVSSPSPRYHLFVSVILDLQHLSHRYQIALITLIYLLPLLVMLVTYSLIGQTLWGSEIPGETSDHYQNQIQAKRKVSYVILMKSLD